MLPTLIAQDTRNDILKAAFAEIYQHGYTKTGINQIIERTSVTKGALYHHFSSKKEIGIAIINELLRPRHDREWLMPMRETSDPLQTLKMMLQTRLDELGEGNTENCGCPINNLVQELAQEDEDFRVPLADILSDWILTIKASLTRGQSAGTVAKSVDAESAAAFIVTYLEGAPCLVKTDPSAYWIQQSMRGLFNYLDTLLPA